MYFVKVLEFYSSTIKSANIFRTLIMHCFNTLHIEQDYYSLITVRSFRVTEKLVQGHTDSE